AFANADGGTLAIGIDDNGELSGTNYTGAHSLDEYELAIQQDIIGQPSIDYSKLDYESEDGKNALFIIHIDCSKNKLIKNRSEEVY
ncbi:ATP-binding protein, partial [Escherichia coli]|nr:ATP-binding protein [Escherichia coli]